MTKPFSPRILLARIRAVLRRKNLFQENLSAKINIKELEVNPGMRAVWVEGKPVDLTFTEFEILLFLARRPGWVFTRSQIVDAVRGEDYAVTERSVDVHVAGLRKKMGAFGSYIETVRGVGYRLKDDEVS